MARILVSKDNFDECLLNIKYDYIAFDTETTGLNPYRGARLFSCIVSDSENDYYFNFNLNPDHLGNYVPKEYQLKRGHLVSLFQGIFLQKDLTIFMQNAKFDMHMVHVEDIIGEFKAEILCTATMSRLINNQLKSYSLSYLGTLIGHEKDDTVDKYISKHKLYTEVDVGKKKPRKDKHFDLVPFEIISEYGLTDGRVTYELGMHCLKRIKEMSEEQINQGLKPLSDVLDIETRCTKALFDMEARGALLDVDYCKEAYEYEVEKYQEAAQKFYALTGVEFQDAASCFKEVFKKLGLKAGVTEKGNDSYSADNLPDNPVTELILEYRKHYKRATTYFKNYLDIMDNDGVLHCSFVQYGTTTGRLSSRDPNLQNVPKHGEDDSEYPIRKAFKPRDGYFFAMIDFDQMEYRLLMDTINEAEVIRMILEEGLDVHTATSQLANVKRLIAKNINFLSIYGGGAGKLREYTKGTLAEAKKMMQDYFAKLKKVKPFMKAIEKKAKQRGYVVNPMGRRLLLHKDRPYVMTNHYIQGGCADIMKLAMARMYDYLADKKSNMLLQVHDEIVFEIAYGEEYVLEELKKIMENAYNYQHLPLTVGIDFSKTDWFNKKGWEEYGSA